MNSERYIDLPLLERQARAYIADHASEKPRLSELDYKIWQPFHAEVDLAVWDVGYDLDLGEGRQLPLPMDPAVAEMWKSLTVRRADVVLISMSRIVVLEIKPVGASEIVGQLELDRQAASETPLAKINAEWAGLCDYTAPHSREYMRDRGLLLFDLQDLWTWHDYLNIRSYSPV